ncbi:MAG: acetyl-CoA carboxylase carboxyltransferase subunit alpha [Gammaproteobacteria bacterium]
MTQLLDFESGLESLEAEIKSLAHSAEDADIVRKMRALRKKRDAMLARLYDNMSDWQTCQVARHPARPQARDYIGALFDGFTELRGDRTYGDDPAVIAGLGKLNDKPVVVIGQQKGRDTAEKIRRNFGMSNPEGYRKALRMMDLADKFSLPLIAFVDTPGAYPGIGAEERGQSGAIGQCLYRAATMRAPMLTVIIGEGGSGGALAFAAGDYVAMLRYAVYSVISPEGCASILWKEAARMSDAAEMLGLTAPKLKKRLLIDEVISEPPGGAHRDAPAAIAAVGAALEKALATLERPQTDALLQSRRERWRNYGVYTETRA